jgi:hypothetical protein
LVGRRGRCKRKPCDNDGYQNAGDVRQRGSPPKGVFLPPRDLPWVQKQIERFDPRSSETAG